MTVHDSAPVPGPAAVPHAPGNRRQVLYWGLLARVFSGEAQPALDTAGLGVLSDLGLPAALLDPTVSIDAVVQRFPELAAEIEGVMSSTAPDPEAGSEPHSEQDSEPHTERDTEQDSGRDTERDAEPHSEQDSGTGTAEVRRAALVSKVLGNLFATGSGPVTAQQLAAWQSDATWLARALGCRPGDVDGLGTALKAIEADLVSRMHLREVLADSARARRLTPSMSLVEQLLRDKENLSGVALANARALIRRFVDEVAEVLRTEVAKATTGTIDRSVPPKRVFRNLDLNRTIWKNLTNYSAEDGRLYVDRLHYRHTARRTTPARMIVVVDQSGSMVDSMVNCTILASIFAELPNVDMHLIAYDTEALDLTPWVDDPFEVLLRTQLGGGTDGTAALDLARPKITDPAHTVVVWISDFYEGNEAAVFAGLEGLHRSGVRLIPVGSVTSGGQAVVNPTFRRRLRDLGAPVLSGHIRKLVTELKNFLT